MTAGDGSRCRWHADGHGRCPNPQAFPGIRDVPELCTVHLGALEPWVAARAVQRSGHADEWIEWAARRAAEVQDIRRALGESARPLRAAPQQAVGFLR